MRAIWRGVAMCGAMALLIGVFSTAAHPADGQRLRSTKVCGPTVGHPYRHGIRLTVASRAQFRACRTTSKVSKLAAQELMSFHGGTDGHGSFGVTSGTPKVYLVVLGSQWGTQTLDAQGNSHFSHDPNG